VFSTAPPPAVADALDESISIVEGEPERRHRLLSLARVLRDRLAASGVPVPAGVSQIVPIVLGGNEAAVAVAAALRRDGFDVRAIRPPSVPPGTARLRVSLNAGLDDATLDRFVGALRAALDSSRVHACAAVSS
jgi:8-amino-7-oxononanoate synthase